MNDELNPQQKEAVMYNEGPSLVIAGAGSGKTRVLTFKVAYLLDLGLEPDRILALTFTNKAAREMKQRIADMVGYKKARNLAMGTFHSIFSRILRSEAPYAGLDPNYTIYDTDDCKSLVRGILHDLNIDPKKEDCKGYTPSAVINRISAAKNEMLFPDDYQRSDWAFYDVKRNTPRMGEIYKEYARRLKDAKAVDFDDLLLLTYVLFRDCPAVLQKYRERFQFVLVDEYQDTNTLQYLIVKLLADQHRRICVVGDDAQSIYAFRGAKIGNILNFGRNFPEAVTFKLERNYRSTSNIVDAAGSLIKANKGQLPKNVYSEKPPGSKVSVIHTYKDEDEARMVAEKIVDMVDGGGTYNDFAILYRTNAQSRKLEDALRGRNIPYIIYGGLSFYQRKEVKDIMAYLRLIVNSADNEAFKRVVNYPARGIGKTTLDKVAFAALNADASMFDVADRPAEFAVQVNAGTASKLQGFTALIKQLAQDTAEADAYETAKAVVEAIGIKFDESEYFSLTVEERSEMENIAELLNGIMEFCARQAEDGESASLRDFLNLAALATDQDTKKESDTPQVKLMTVHAAKGLEFKNVFVTGMEEGVFPGILSALSPEDIEEERRLLYVAITRAEENCILSYADERYQLGKVVFNKPSRFLNEINPKYLSHSTYGYKTPSIDFGSRNESFFTRRYKTSFEDNYRTPKPEYEAPARTVAPQPQRQSLKQLSSTVGDSVQSAPYGKATLEVGTRVEHAAFGIGTVQEISQSPDGYRIKVAFDDGNARMMLLKFAKLTVKS